MDERLYDCPIKKGGDTVKQTKAEKFEELLQKEFERWEQLYIYGGNDPFYEDGVNLNLIRNHIISYKMKCKEELKTDEYPQDYFKSTPPEIDDTYMARKNEIRKNAKNTLHIYLEDLNYKYILKTMPELTPDQADKANLGNVLGYVEGLQQAIKEDKLVWMRRHELPDNYLESFKECRKRIDSILKVKRKLPEGQLSIFDLFEM